MNIEYFLLVQGNSIHSSDQVQLGPSPKTREGSRLSVYIQKEFLWGSTRTENQEEDFECSSFFKQPSYHIFYIVFLAVRVALKPNRKGCNMDWREGITPRLIPASIPEHPYRKKKMLKGGLLSLLI